MATVENCAIWTPLLNTFQKCMKPQGPLETRVAAFLLLTFAFRNKTLLTDSSPSTVMTQSYSYILTNNHVEYTKKTTLILIKSLRWWCWTNTHTINCNDSITQLHLDKKSRWAYQENNFNLNHITQIMMCNTSLTENAPFLIHSTTSFCRYFSFLGW